MCVRRDVYIRRHYGVAECANPAIVSAPHAIRTISRGTRSCDECVMVFGGCLCVCSVCMWIRAHMRLYLCYIHSMYECVE